MPQIPCIAFVRSGPHGFLFENLTACGREPHGPRCEAHVDRKILRMHVTRCEPRSEADLDLSRRRSPRGIRVRVGSHDLDVGILEFKGPHSPAIRSLRIEIPQPSSRWRTDFDDQVVDDVRSLGGTSWGVLVGHVGVALSSSCFFLRGRIQKSEPPAPSRPYTENGAMVMWLPRCRRLDVGRSSPTQKKVACLWGSFYASRVRAVQRCAPASSVADDICHSRTPICR
jgi:hypothetical protein